MIMCSVAAHLYQYYIVDKKNIWNGVDVVVEGGEFNHKFCTYLHTNSKLVDRKREKQK